MTQQDRIGYDVERYIKPRIGYNTHFEQYTFNGNWLQSVDTQYFLLKSNNLKHQILRYISIQVDVKFLEYLRDFVQKQFEQNHIYEMLSFTHLDEYKSAIKETDDEDCDEPPMEEIPYENVGSEMTWNDFRVSSDFADFIGRNWTIEELDTNESFQKAKLLYILSLHRNAVEEFGQFLEDLIEEANISDLKAHCLYLLTEAESLKGLPTSTAATMPIPPATTGGNVLKCGTTMSKKNLARFFVMWMETGLLFMDDSDKANNRTELQRFIEANFTYSGDQKVQTGISTITKQFTEIAWSQRQDQKAYVDALINDLQKYRDSIKN